LGNRNDPAGKSPPEQEFRPKSNILVHHSNNKNSAITTPNSPLLEWLQELQIASKVRGTHGGNAVLIMEAMSSKFLAGSGKGSVPLVQLGKGIGSGVTGLHDGQQFDIVPSSSRMSL